MSSFVESNLYQHAKKELELVGYDFSSDEKTMDNLMRDNILDLLRVFYKQEHSELTANYIIDVFRRLARFQPLKPVTDEEEEWVEVAENLYQHKRLAGLFKNGETGRSHYLDAIIFVDQDGITFTSNNIEGISSSQYVKSFPFVPKTFFVNVISYEVNKDDETILEHGSGWWKSKIKDMEQLKSVWEYYDKM
jgi:hypothetical protein